MSSNPVHGEEYVFLQYYVIKFASDLRQVSGFLRVLPVSSTNKPDRHDITEILLKMALTTKLIIYFNIPQSQILRSYGASHVNVYIVHAPQERGLIIIVFLLYPYIEGEQRPQWPKDKVQKD